MDSRAKLVIKVVWMVHFVLTTWALLSTYLAGVPAYYLTQLGVLAFGFWAIVQTENIHALMMFLVTLIFSVLNDILIISIYQPRADTKFEDTRNYVPTGYLNEYRFALGMSIVNILLKPLTIFLVYLVYKSVSNGSEFTVPFVENSAGLFTSSTRPNQGQYTTVESAQDSYPGIHGRPPHQYHQGHPQQGQGQATDTKTDPNNPPPYNM